MDYTRLFGVLCLSIFLIVGCVGQEGKEGSVVTIDYRNAKIGEGDWVQIDSFRFEHIGERDGAKKVKYPLPSRKVFVDSMGDREFSRDYNPKVLPVYISRHLERINESLPESKSFEVGSHFMLSYKGVLKINKSDSSSIKVKSSEGYDPQIETGSK